jgi:hypothetical protein
MAERAQRTESRSPTERVRFFALFDYEHKTFTLAFPRLLFALAIVAESRLKTRKHFRRSLQ